MDHQDLQAAWALLCSGFTTNKSLIQSCWSTIEKAYSAPARAYHNLDHLLNMFTHLERLPDSIKAELDDLAVLQFSIWLHDLIYDAKRKDNERKSADEAMKMLRQLGVEQERIERVETQIMLTQKHIALTTAPFDDRLLLDLDLSILATDDSTYKAYGQQVRKEYKMYPMFLYKRGRKAALRSFLERDRVFYTPYFYEWGEEKARENLRREIERL